MPKFANPLNVGVGHLDGEFLSAAIPLKPKRRLEGEPGVCYWFGQPNKKAGAFAPAFFFAFA
jgi:hypothetical protein